MNPFDDVLAANDEYRSSYRDAGLTGRAARGLAVVTCIDSRLDPLAMLGLRPGDAKIIRNAGARITDDALRSLVLAVNLLDVTRVAVVQHTNCAVIGSADEELRDRVTEAAGVDASGWCFEAGTDGEGLLRADVARVRSCELLPASLEVGGFLYDVHTGGLKQLV
jgi:carbonic anhydrase